MRTPQGDPCVIVIFGGTGDLMQKKLLPSLFRLASNESLPPDCQVLGVARDRALTDKQFRAWARQALAAAGLPEKNLRWCERCLHYQAVDPQDPADFKALGARIAALEA
ncbi:MAG: glucose-6-phosphate dehydrogenase, partial [Betaproteobacteria bacterium]